MFFGAVRQFTRLLLVIVTGVICGIITISLSPIACNKIQS